MLINLALRRKENWKFKANLGYIARLFQKKKKKERKSERKGEDAGKKGRKYSW